MPARCPDIWRGLGNQLLGLQASETDLRQHSAVCVGCVADWHTYRGCKLSPGFFKRTEAKKKRITYLHGKKYPKGTHYCATHVEHHDWGIGQPIHGQHAKPDQYGDIDWYDVMFEHGIEKRVPTDDLHILVGEGHGNENHQWENGEEKATRKRRFYDFRFMEATAG